MRNIYLKCVSGPLAGQIFHLDGGPVFIFGRYAKAHFSLAADPAASHLHFLVDISDNRVRILDLGSTNGLVVNGRHLGGKFGLPMKEFATLRHDDAILSGGSLFRLIVEEDETAGSRNADDPMSRAIGARRSGSTRRGKVTLISGPNRPFAGADAEAGEKRLSFEEPEQTDPPDAAASQDEDSLPAVAGYTIIEKIGGGGKGVVYKAIKDDSGVTAAIKMMLFNRNKSKKQRSLEMFRREIQITRQLKHPNIIRYLGDGISKGLPYLALEYAGGGNLSELIGREPEKRMDLPQTVPLFIQLLEAVAHMHSLSLVHRDIKPKNILLDVRRGGSLAVKLSDMGLSCRFSSQDYDDFLPIISEGGTPAYMPPEQLTDLTRAIPQSDVFSAAATFYQMLTGSLLYDFTDRDQTDAILEGNIKPILYLRPDLPLGLANVISKGLSYNPENRYANAQEMLEVLKKSLN